MNVGQPLDVTSMASMQPSTSTANQSPLVVRIDEDVALKQMSITSAPSPIFRQLFPDEEPCRRCVGYQKNAERAHTLIQKCARNSQKLQQLQEEVKNLNLELDKRQANVFELLKKNETEVTRRIQTAQEIDDLNIRLECMKTERDVAREEAATNKTLATKATSHEATIKTLQRTVNVMTEQQNEIRRKMLMTVKLATSYKAKYEALLSGNQLPVMPDISSGSTSPRSAKTPQPDVDESILLAELSDFSSVGSRTPSPRKSNARSRRGGANSDANLVLMERPREMSPVRRRGARGRAANPANVGRRTRSQAKAEATEFRPPVPTLPKIVPQKSGRRKSTSSIRDPIDADVLMDELESVDDRTTVERDIDTRGVEESPQKTPQKLRRRSRRLSSTSSTGSSVFGSPPPSAHFTRSRGPVPTDSEIMPPPTSAPTKRTRQVSINVPVESMPDFGMPEPTVDVVPTPPPAPIRAPKKAQLMTTRPKSPKKPQPVVEVALDPTARRPRQPMSGLGVRRMGTKDVENATTSTAVVNTEDQNRSEAKTEVSDNQPLASPVIIEAETATCAAVDTDFQQPVAVEVSQLCIQASISPSRTHRRVSASSIHSPIDANILADELESVDERMIAEREADALGLDLVIRSGSSDSSSSPQKSPQKQKRKSRRLSTTSSVRSSVFGSPTRAGKDPAEREAVLPVVPSDPERSHRLSTDMPVESMPDVGTPMEITAAETSALSVPIPKTPPVPEAPADEIPTAADVTAIEATPATADTATASASVAAVESISELQAPVAHSAEAKSPQMFTGPMEDSDDEELGALIIAESQSPRHPVEENDTPLLPSIAESTVQPSAAKSQEKASAPVELEVNPTTRRPDRRARKDKPASEATAHPSKLSSPIMRPPSKSPRKSAAARRSAIDAAMLLDELESVDERTPAEREADIDLGTNSQKRSPSVASNRSTISTRSRVAAAALQMATKPARRGRPPKAAAPAKAVDHEESGAVEPVKSAPPKAPQPKPARAVASRAPLMPRRTLGPVKRAPAEKKPPAEKKAPTAKKAPAEKKAPEKRAPLEKKTSAEKKGSVEKSSSGDATKAKASKKTANKDLPAGTSEALEVSIPKRRTAPKRVAAAASTSDETSTAKIPKRRVSTKTTPIGAPTPTEAKPKATEPHRVAKIESSVSDDEADSPLQIDEDYVEPTPSPVTEPPAPVRIVSSVSDDEADSPLQIDEGDPDSPLQIVEDEPSAEPTVPSVVIRSPQKSRVFIDDSDDEELGALIIAESQSPRRPDEQAESEAQPSTSEPRPSTPTNKMGSNVMDIMAALESPEKKPFTLPSEVKPAELKAPTLIVPKSSLKSTAAAIAAESGNSRKRRGQLFDAEPTTLSKPTLSTTPRKSAPEEISPTKPPAAKRAARVLPAGARTIQLLDHPAPIPMKRQRRVATSAPTPAESGRLNAATAGHSSPLSFIHPLLDAYCTDRLTLVEVLNRFNSQYAALRPKPTSGELVAEMSRFMRGFDIGDLWFSLSQSIRSGTEIRQVISKPESNFFEFVNQLTAESQWEKLFLEYFKVASMEVLKAAASSAVQRERDYRCLLMALRVIRDELSDDEYKSSLKILVTMLDTMLLARDFAPSVKILTFLVALDPPIIFSHFLFDPQITDQRSILLRLHFCSAPDFASVLFGLIERSEGDVPPNALENLRQPLADAEIRERLAEQMRLCAAVPTPLIQRGDIKVPAPAIARSVKFCAALVSARGFHRASWYADQPPAMRTILSAVLTEGFFTSQRS